MRYPIHSITKNVQLQEILLLLSKDISKESCVAKYEEHRVLYPALSHHDDVFWMIYIHLSEYADGTIDRETAFDRIIEHAMDAGIINSEK